MPDSKIPQLPAKTQINANDLFYLIDVEDTTDDPTGSSKKITRASFQTVFNGKENGIAADGVVVTDGAINNTSPILTSATGYFTPNDVGKIIMVVGAGASGADLHTTVLSYQSANQVTLSANASTTVTGATVVWGTNDTTALQNALTNILASKFSSLYLPKGIITINDVSSAVLTNHDLYIDGDSIINTKIYNLSTAKDALNISSSGGAGEFFSISNLSFIGTSSCHRGLVLSSLQRGNIKNIRADNFTFPTSSYGTGVFFDHDVYSFVTENLSGNNNTHATLDIGNDANNANTFIGGWYLSGGAGIRIEGASRGNRFINCILQSNAYGVSITGTAEDTTFEGCWIENNSVAGMHSTATKLRVVGCQFNITQPVDIELATGAQHTTIEDNDFSSASGIITIAANVPDTTIQYNKGLITVTDNGLNTVIKKNPGYFTDTDIAKLPEGSLINGKIVVSPATHFNGNTDTDQSYDVNSASDNITNTNTVAQSFTPTIADLTSIAFRLNNQGVTHDITLNLYKWNTDYATTIAGAVIATANIARASIAANYNYKTINLPATLIAGAKYLVVLTTAETTSNWFIRSNIAGTYANGDRYINGSAAGDIAFITNGRGWMSVALKGVDGNDPSTTNPVYVKIGGVVRAITAALSSLMASGINACNAGGAELAGKEVDYFVYLSYNSIDGMVLGVSRYANAQKFSDFSADGTNEKGINTSGDSNSAANDSYNIIARFAATLTPTALLYTLPVYDARNLIQRFIDETRWLNWLPSGAGYAAGGARYKIKRDTLFLNIDSTANITGNSSAPFTAVNTVDNQMNTDTGTAVIAKNTATITVASNPQNINGFYEI